MAISYPPLDRGFIKAFEFGVRACSVSFGVRIFGKILSMTRQKAAVILAVLQGFLTQSAAKD